MALGEAIWWDEHTPNRTRQTATAPDVPPEDSSRRACPRKDRQDAFDEGVELGDVRA